MRIGILIILALWLVPGVLAAKGIFEIEAVALGVSVEESSLIVIRQSQPGSDFENGSEGTLVSERQALPFLSILFAPTKFGENRAFSVSASYIPIKFSRQEVEKADGSGSDNVDLGTSAEGFAATLTFELSYLSGDTFENDFFQVGIGVGPGYLSVEGDVILDDPAQTRFPFSVEGPAVAVSLFLKWRTGPVYIAATANNSLVFGSKHKITASRAGLDLGIIF